MNTELLKQAAESLTPVGIFLRNSKTLTASDFVPQHARKDLQVQYKSKPIAEYKLLQDEDENVSSVIFQYEVGVRLVDESLDDKGEGFLQAEILATFASEYRLASPDDFNEDAMTEFLNCNVRFHVWPFWREFLQSTCTRMGLPVIPLTHHFHTNPDKKADQ